jgi:hypothetical protein
MKTQGLLAFTLLGIEATLGAVFFQKMDDLPQNVEYDFIIAGGEIYTLSGICELCDLQPHE